MTPINLTDEDQLIKLLRQVIDGEVTIDPKQLDFKEWPRLVIHLKGERFHQSITPPVMSGLLDLQREINRAFALVRYNTSRTNSLKKIEREQIEITVEVEDGSSTLEIDFQKILETFIQEAASKMEPNHIVITVLGVALMYFGHSAYRLYLENRRQERLQSASDKKTKQILESMEILSQEETQRIKLITSLREKDYRMQNLSDNADEVHNSLVKTAAAAQEAEINDTQLDREEAKLLSRHGRRKSKEVRMDGRYRITKVDATDPDSFKVTIENLDSGESITATVQDDSANDRHKNTLQKAEWNRIPLQLKINARLVGDDIRSAVIIDARLESND